MNKMINSLNISGIYSNFTQKQISHNKYNFIIVSLMMLDYLLTYVGIHHFDCITEGNMFMVWLFELPFVLGVLVRITQCSVIYILLRYIQIKGNQYYNKLILLLITLEIGVILAHLVWIIVRISLFIYKIYLIAQIRV